jgi:CotH kinase protein
MEDSAYKASLRCRWKQVRSNSLSLSRINQLIDSVVTLTTEARQRHFVRWPVLGVTIWPNPTPVPTSYEGEISTLKNWINNRLTWIDNSVPNNGACYDYPEDIKQNIIIKLTPNPVEGNAQLSIQARNNQRLNMTILTDGQYGTVMQIYLLVLAICRYPPYRIRPGYMC